MKVKGALIVLSPPPSNNILQARPLTIYAPSSGVCDAIAGSRGKSPLKGLSDALYVVEALGNQVHTSTINVYATFYAEFMPFSPN